MAEESRIAIIVQQAVAQVLESHLPQLQRDLTALVLKELHGQDGNTSPSGGAAGDLLKAVSLIHGGTTQKEILRALLESTSQYSGRAALFVMKAGAANGWQGRGFDNNDDIKDFALDVSAPAASQVLQVRTAIDAHVADMDPKFISRFGAPSQDQILLLPLHLKDKIAALVYADGGMDGAGAVATSALELLVAATSAWLEVASLRKQAAKEGTVEPVADSSPSPVQTARAYSDPFAGHAPRHTMAAAADAAPVVAASVGTAAAPAPAKDAFAEMSPEDAEIHRKAQRFARLLTDEIKLYNQAKVAEGRKHKDLYDRLKEDIEKSRVTYVKRYGNTAAASGDYFNNELVRSLAGDDVLLMGPNFRR